MRVSSLNTTMQIMKNTNKALMDSLDIYGILQLFYQSWNIALAF